MFDGKQASYECKDMGKQQLLKQTYLKLITVDDFQASIIKKKVENVYAKDDDDFRFDKIFSLIKLCADCAILTATLLLLDWHELAFD